MHDASLLTILVPTYNRRELLERALASCFAQTDQRFRLLLIDNASSDGTAEVLLGLEGRPGVQVIRNERNLGPTASINKALRAVATPWVTILCDDDWLEPSFVAAARPVAEKSSADLIVLGFDCVRPDGTVESVSRFERQTLGLREAVTALELRQVPTAGVTGFLFRVPGYQAPYYPKGYWADSFLVLRAAVTNGLETVDGVHFHRLTWAGAESAPTVANLLCYFEALQRFQVDARNLLATHGQAAGSRVISRPMAGLVWYLTATIGTTSSLTLPELRGFFRASWSNDRRYLLHCLALTTLYLTGILHPISEPLRRRLFRNGPPSRMQRLWDSIRGPPRLRLR